MKLNYILIAGVLCTFDSCKEDIQPPIVPEQKFIQSHSLQIGDTNEVKLKTYNTELTGVYHQSPATLDIDVNDDNSADFRFSSEVWGSPGMGIHPRAIIMALNPDSRIYGVIESDTLFTRLATNIQTTDSNVTIYNTRHYACTQITPDYSVSSASEPDFKIVSMGFGEVLSIDDYFTSGAVNFIDEPASYHVIPEVHNDTTTYNLITYDNLCDYFVAGGMYYIGIKVKTAGIDKLGWIKVSISADSNPIIIESGVQN